MNVAETIREKIYKAVCDVAGVCVPAREIHLEHPELEQHGDYSTNIALQITKTQKLENSKTPRELAETVAGAIQVDSLIEKVEVAGPGFINIWLKKEWLVGKMGRIEIPAVGVGKRVVVEYSSPNIAKPFGIGHLSSTIIGQALYNIYQALGYEVIGDNHLGDWGTQFGKLLFMINYKKETNLTIDNLEKLYVEFHQHPEWEPEGSGWFKKLEDGDEEARRIWRKCVEVSLAEFQKIYDLLGVKIDNAYGESAYEDLMPQVVAQAKAKGIAHESEGALVIEVPGIKTPLMLLKSDGGTTYATRDMATVKFRVEKWHPDLVIYEVGGEQALHFAQVFGAARLMGYVDDKSKLVHTKHGLYLDTDGKKFATRKGKTVKLVKVLEEAIERAKKLGNKESAQAVGIGAIKYFNLNHNVQSDVVFDWEKIMALEGNSGPYLQYTYARCRSVLRKAGKIGKDRQAASPEMPESPNAEELMVLRHIYKFAETVEEAARRYAPNLVCNFLYELGQRYNTFYNKHSILTPPQSPPNLGGEAEGGGVNTRAFRLGMTQAVGEVLKKGLGLLGIEVLERM